MVPFVKDLFKWTNKNGMAVGGLSKFEDNKGDDWVEFVPRFAGIFEDNFGNFKGKSKTRKCSFI